MPCWCSLEGLNMFQQVVSKATSPVMEVRSNVIDRCLGSDWCPLCHSFLMLLTTKNESSANVSRSLSSFHGGFLSAEVKNLSSSEVELNPKNGGKCRSQGFVGFAWALKSQRRKYQKMLNKSLPGCLCLYIYFKVIESPSLRKPTVFEKSCFLRPCPAGLIETAGCNLMSRLPTS